MDHLRLIVLGLLLVFLGNARAIDEVPGVVVNTPTVQWGFSGSSPDGVVTNAAALVSQGLAFPSPDGVCGSATFQATGVGSSGWQCKGSVMNGTAPNRSATTYLRNYYDGDPTCNSSCGTGTIASYEGTVNMPTVTCPGASVENSSHKCICIVNFKRGGAANDQCVPYTCENKVLGPTNFGPYSTAGGWKAGANSDGMKFQCNTGTGSGHGCVVAATSSMAMEGADGWYQGVIERQSGVACQGTGTSAASPDSPPPVNHPSDAAAPPATACPTGKAPGTVNGQSVCVDTGKTTSGDQAKTTVNPDGSLTKKQTVTECVAGGCTSTTTTTDQTSSGATTSTKTETTTTTRAAYCAEHAGDPMCAALAPAGGASGSGTGGVDSSFTGSCEGSFLCEGDAVQCAMAKDQHMRHCTVFDKSSIASEKGLQAVQDGIQPADHPIKSADAVGVDFGTGIDTVDLLGGSCPSNQTFAVGGGHTFVVPFANLCEPLGWMGKIVLGFTWLACLFIVFGKRG